MIDEKMIDPKVLDAVAIAISGAPFVTKQSLRKARAAILAYESAKQKEAEATCKESLQVRIGSRLTVEAVEAVVVPFWPSTKMLAAAQTEWLADPARKSSTLYRAMLSAVAGDGR